jgi:hypothetical protein
VMVNKTYSSINGSRPSRKDERIEDREDEKQKKRKQVLIGRLKQNAQKTKGALCPLLFYATRQGSIAVPLICL